MDSRLSEAMDVILAELKITPTPIEDMEVIQYPTGLPLDIAEQHGRAVMIALLRGNKQMAYDIVDRAFESKNEGIVTSATSVDAVFSTKLANRLVKLDLRTVGNILEMSMAELAGYRGFSLKSALSVEKTLIQHGLHLKR